MYTKMCVARARVRVFVYAGVHAYIYKQAAVARLGSEFYAVFFRDPVNDIEGLLQSYDAAPNPSNDNNVGIPTARV